MGVMGYEDPEYTGSGLSKVRNLAFTEAEIIALRDFMRENRADKERCPDIRSAAEKIERAYLS